MAGKAAQTSREMPAMISFLRPVASIAAATLGSSQALTVDRSMILMPGRASTSSGNVGPHMLSRAVVVTMIGRFSAFAAFARATTLCFSFDCKFISRDHRNPQVRLDVLGLLLPDLILLFPGVLEKIFII